MGPLQTPFLIIVGIVGGIFMLHRLMHGRGRIGPVFGVLACIVVVIAGIDMSLLTSLAGVVKNGIQWIAGKIHF